MGFESMGHTVHAELTHTKGKICNEIKGGAIRDRSLTSSVDIMVIIIVIVIIIVAKAQR